jgi:HAD superfamily phosphatase (TIGR01668 family)
MFDKLYPKEYKTSAYVIDYEKMYQKGYRGILFDIDNTLVPHDAPADERSIALFKRLEEIGFSCCFISNNYEERVKAFNEAIGNPYIYRAKKPSKDGFYLGMKAIGTKPSTTFVVGDQLFTDMWGARNAGVYSILVKPIHPKEKWTIVLKRKLEKIVLFFYYRKQRVKESEL